MFKENITVEELAEHELSWFKGEIVLVDNLKTFYEVIARDLEDPTFSVLILKPDPHLKKERKTLFHSYSFPQIIWHVSSG